MKKFFLLLAGACLMSSCGTTLKLSGSYPESNQYTETSLPYDEVWSKIIDFFAVNGIPISTIDKTSGLIVASSMSFVNNYTREDKQGNMINPDAYVVIPTVRGGFGNILEPNAKITGHWDMVGDWNVRIKNIDNKTLINVNLLNVRCLYSTSGLYGSSSKIPIRSTGKFEKMLLDTFK